MGIIDDIFGKEKSSVTGWMGETFTEFELMLVKLFGRDGKILRNVYVPKGDGTYSEIDVLYITRKCIFVLESKNYSGWIFGDAFSNKWTVCLPKNQRYQFYNPIKQNDSHIKWLSKYLNNSRAKFYSIIVFSDRCELKKVPQLSDIPVIKRYNLYSAMKNIWETNPDILSTDDVMEIWLKLNDNAHQDASVKKQHIENIKGDNIYPKSNSYNNTTSSYTDSIRANYTASNTNISANNTMSMASAARIIDDSNTPVSVGRSIQGTSGIFDDFFVTKTKSEKTLCPRCGSELVIRTARKGEHKLNRFYGCSSFPKCRFIKDI